MLVSEKHSISRHNTMWKQCDKLCFLSKNLYNQALYRIKKEYTESNKLKRYLALEKEMRKEKQVDYISLPPNTSQQILLILDRNLKSYIVLLKKWKSDKKSLRGCPKFPYYKDKLQGRNVVIFTANQFTFKKGYLHFCKKSGLFPLKTTLTSAKQVRVIPQSGCYKIEIIYERQEVQADVDKNKFIGIDLGVNNLATITSNDPGLRPIIINGRPIKSINQFYNKRRAQLQKDLIRRNQGFRSIRLIRLAEKRKNKIDSYLHLFSKEIVNYCLFNKIGNIVIGKNKEWKTRVNIGKRNNQNFVCIPFTKFIQMIKYKSQLVGITVQDHEESYTSKVDHLTIEPIQHQEKYLGKRVKRGLFQSSIGITLNADVNGSIGILRKVIGDGFISKIDRGLVLRPLKLKFHEASRMKIQVA